MPRPIGQTHFPFRFVGVRMHVTWVRQGTLCDDDIIVYEYGLSSSRVMDPKISICVFSRKLMNWVRSL